MRTATRRFIENWIDRRAPASAEAQTLDYRRVYILPTKQGFVFSIMLVVMWLGAINYNNSLAFALTFLLAGVYLAAMVHTYRNLVGLSVMPGRTANGFRGDNVAFTLHLESTDPRDRVAIELATTDEAQHEPVDIDAGEGTAVTLQVPGQTRGRHKLGRIVLATRYPTGLFRAWSRLHPIMEALVYPAPEQGEIPPPENLGDRARGDQQASGDEDFAGLRRYQPGDPIRRIAWKATHVEELQVKVFAGEGAARLWLDWAATDGLLAEARLERLCRWLQDAHNAGRVYGLRLPDESIAPSAGATHYHRCLRALALYET